MSEQQQKPKSFMQELGEWNGVNIFVPLYIAAQQMADDDGDITPWKIAIEKADKAIRQRVLESYRNGQAAGPTTPRSSSGSKPRRQPAPRA